jgi:hypothetical protein
MTTDYVQEKAALALQATAGDKDEAQKLLLSWAARDQALLLGLAKPHLKGMVAFALEQVTRIEIPAPMEPTPEDSAERRRALGAQAGLRRSASPAELQAETQNILDPMRQADTWQAIAAAFKKKKTE